MKRSGAGASRAASSGGRVSWCGSPPPPAYHIRFRSKINPLKSRMRTRRICRPEAPASQQTVISDRDIASDYRRLHDQWKRKKRSGLGESFSYFWFDNTLSDISILEIVVSSLIIHPSMPCRAVSMSFTSVFVSLMFLSISLIF